MRNFRNYKIWNESVNFTTEIYKIINAFPSFEKFALADQLRRASVSIASNIAEGSARESEREFAHFLSISLGSAFEVETQLQIAHNLGYINQQLLDLLLKKIHPLERQINELITVIKRKSQQPKANS
jgi:four helix bundle protein